jgi:hypothetical protein
MRKKLFFAVASVFLAVAAMVLPISSAYAIETFAMETELRIYDATKSYNGYFMPSNYDMGTGNTTYLMDMEGYVVKKWNAIFGWAPVIQEDGTVWSGGYIHDWDGKVIWSYTTAPYMAHHAWRKMWNKKLNQWTMLVLCNRAMTQAEAVAMGMNPGVTYGNRITAIDFLAEISMDKQIVWEWHPWDHGTQSVNPSWPNYVSDVALAPNRFDVNWLTDAQQPAISGTAGTFSDWFHVNSIDYDDDTGHIVVNPKHWSDFFVIDHDKTFVSATDWAANKAAAASATGDLLYRWGNPSSYNSGRAPGFMTEGDSQMYGSHDIQFIDPYHWKKPHLATDTWPDPSTYTKSGISLPGAGNFLIFDNGCYNPAGMRSRALEINGRIGASGAVEAAVGKYIWQPTAGYQSTNTTYHKSRQLVWSFASTTQHSFYSSHISSVQRLPNGNTNVAAGNQGHFFEVTPNGTVVWEYLYPGIPGTVAGPMGGGFNKINYDKTGAANCYRSYRYGTDYPAFTGKTLERQGTLSGRVPRLVGSSDAYPPGVTYTGFGFGGTGVTVGGGGVGSGAGGGGGSGY